MVSVNNKVTTSSASSSKQGVKKQQQQPQLVTSTSIEKERESSVTSTSGNTAVAAAAAAAPSGTKSPQEQPEFIKQGLILFVNKVRNLDKRLQKLDIIKDNEKRGKVPLTPEQVIAVSKYDEVKALIELAKELEKAFMGIASDAQKSQKKQAKKEQIEKDEAIKEKLKEIQKFSIVLDMLGEDSIRNDFTSGKNGAIKLTTEEFILLDEVSGITRPFVEAHSNKKLEMSIIESSETLCNLIDGKAKEFRADLKLKNVVATYADVKKLLENVFASTYWTQTSSIKAVEQQIKEAVAAPTPAAVATTTPADQVEAKNAVVESAAKTQAPVSTTISNEHSEKHTEKGTKNIPYQQRSEQNSSGSADDYVFVSTTDLEHVQPKTTVPINTPTSPNAVQQPQSPQQQQQQQQQQQLPKTFFTTLNPSDMPVINEFLNPKHNEESSINFLQDSEIQYNTNNQQNEQFQPQNNQQFNHNNEDQKSHHQNNDRDPSHHNPNNINNLVGQQQQQRPRNSNSSNYGPRDSNVSKTGNNYAQNQQSRPRYNNVDQNDHRPRNGPAPGAPHRSSGGPPRNNDNNGGYRGGQGQTNNNTGYRGNNNNNRDSGSDQRGPRGPPRNTQNNNFHSQQHPQSTAS